MWDRIGGSSLCPRRRRSIGAAARVDQSGLHDSGRGQGGTVAGGVRRPGAKDRRAGRAGGVEVDPSGSERSQIMEILGIRRGRDVGRAYVFLLERRMEDGSMVRNALRKSYLAGGPISTPRLASAPNSLRPCDRKRSGLRNSAVLAPWTYKENALTAHRCFIHRRTCCSGLSRLRAFQGFLEVYGQL